MSNDKSLSKFELILTAGLILTVLGSIVYFLFHGWSNFQDNERKIWEEEKNKFSAEIKPVGVSLNKDFGNDPLVKTGDKYLEMVFRKKSGSIGIIYKFLSYNESWGRIYRIKKDKAGKEEGISLIDRISDFKVEREGNSIKIAVSRYPEKSRWKDIITWQIEFSGSSRASVITPGDISFFGESGGKLPLFIEHPFML